MDRCSWCYKPVKETDNEWPYCSGFCRDKSYNFSRPSIRPDSGVSVTGKRTPWQKQMDYYRDNNHREYGYNPRSNF